MTKPITPEMKLIVGISHGTRSNPRTTRVKAPEASRVPAAASVLVELVSMSPQSRRALTKRKGVCVQRQRGKKHHEQVHEEGWTRIHPSGRRSRAALAYGVLP
jgi:hypothetical protein